MPTGYTAELYDGPQSLSGFIEGCAHAMIYDFSVGEQITPERVQNLSTYSCRCIAGGKS